MKKLHILAALTALGSLTACGHGPLVLDRSELHDARAAIADARAANAEECAPEQLASAETNLNWAAHELAEGVRAGHKVEIAKLIWAAKSDAKKAKDAAIKNCAPPPPPPPAPEPEVIPEPPAPPAPPPPPVMVPLVLKGVNFETASAALTPSSKIVLDEVVASLAANPDVKVELSAHTDSRGKDGYNMKLSQHRADSVRSYLIGKGIAADRMTSKGYGESKPVASNKNAAGRAKNRRVELLRQQ